MKKSFGLPVIKISTKTNLILLVLCTALALASCSSDDDGSEGDEMMQEEETTLDFNLLVDSWGANNFVLESANSSLPDTDVLGLGGTVDLNVNQDGTFTFTLVFAEPPETIMNSGEFRIENNMLQARFEDNMNFDTLEAEISEDVLRLEGPGIFDFSGEGSNIAFRFRGTFFRN